jgi:hypothetical protein
MTGRTAHLLALMAAGADPSTWDRALAMQDAHARPRRASRRPSPARSDRVAVATERAAHLAHPPRGCECPWCLGDAEVARREAAHVAAQRAAIGDPPF